MAGRAEVLLTAEGFRAWLAKHAPEEIVGRRHDDCDCPLAHYLQEMMPSDAPITVLRTIWRDEKSWYHGLPGWAVAFVARIDRSKLETVTARRAMRVLARVTA